MSGNSRYFENKDECAMSLAMALAGALQDRLAHKERVSLVLSGGNSPKDVLPKLAVADVDWSRVDVLLSDERWVPPDHIDSNAKLIKDYFLDRGAGSASFHPMWIDEHSPEAALERVHSHLQAIGPPFDIAYLGMGPDGHFASLFPGSDAMAFDDKRLNVVAALAPSEPTQRISLSLSAILQTEMAFLHVTGAEKQAMLEHATSLSPTPECPISLLLDLYQRELEVYVA